MPIRDLTENEQSRLLSQVEVNNLPEGTKINVKWGGGNGPYEYRVYIDSRGRVYAKGSPGVLHQLYPVGKSKHFARVYR